jgi:hypothetical protein
MLNAAQLAILGILGILGMLGGILGKPAGGDATSSLPLSFNQVPEQFKEFVPEEVKKFYEELTDEDRVVIKEIAANHASYETEEQALEALKTKSAKLHEKAVALRKLVKDKIDSLKPEAKTFIESMIEKLKSLRPKGEEKPNLEKLRAAANELIEKYKALSQEAKDNLKTTFPKTHAIVENEKFQKLAKGLLKTGDEGAAAPAA